MKETANAIKQAIKDSKNVLVASHIDPDGDSLGSMLAMGQLLTQFGLKVDYYSEDGVPKNYRFLPGSDKVRRTPTPNRIYDQLFAMDASDISRLGDKAIFANFCKNVINIDHHPDNTKYGDINYVALTSSTAELVYKLSKQLGLKINRGIAENLYVALITDTGNFRYENTSPATFEMASDLLKTGINTHSITTRIYDNKNLANIKIQAEALTNLESAEDGKVAWAMVNQEMMEKYQAKSEDLIGLVDQLRSIETTEVAILFREEEGHVKINFRSKEKINVSQIAKHFGGGGHIRAAGAVVRGRMDMVKNEVVAEVIKHLKASKYLA
ncbi:MAG: bifunctional oligoribonuclease/PAP phosphatase NrnA [bacterium]